MSTLKEYFSWLNNFFPRKRTDLRPFWICIIAAISLTGMNYFSAPSSCTMFTPFLNLFSKHWSADLVTWLYGKQDSELNQLIYWSAWSSFFYFALPFLAIKLVWREKLSDYGFKLSGATNGWPIYLGLLLLILPFVFIVSYNKGFQGTYPFYTPPKEDFMSKMIIWELFYALQFITLEFFFRGFMVHGLKNKLGVYSIPVMMVPYCMLHFGKPMPECLGSIMAGLILGTLSYRYKSVILGACIHISVAITMDFLSLWHKGFF